MRRDRKVLRIDLYGCSSKGRIKNKISENCLYFIPFLTTEKQGRNSNNFSKVVILINKRIFSINVSFQ